MKRFILILLTGMFWSNIGVAKEQAIDICGKVKPCINDYKIDNMGVGDSLLDFFEKKEIKKAKAKYRKYKNNKYTMLIIPGEEKYDEVWISYLTKDKKYEISYIKGVKVIGDKDQCIKEREKFKIELTSSWAMVFMKSKTNPETYLLGKSALGRNWVWGSMGCTPDGTSAFDLYMSTHTETWAAWYRKAYIAGKS